MDSHDIWFLSIFRKYGEKTKVVSNMTRITNTLYEDLCTFMIVSRSVLLEMRNVSDKLCTENKTHILG